MTPAAAGGTWPEATGGAVPDGTYVLTAVDLYQQSPLASVVFRMTIDVKGATWRSILELSGVSDASEWKVALSGTELDIQVVCPAGSLPGVGAYSSSGATLTLFRNKKDATFVLTRL